MPYLGQSPSKGDENNFKILDDISSYTLTFDGSDSSVVSAANDTITSLTHRFVQGQRVTYTDGDGSAIAGLTDATVYFIIKEDHNTIKLATSASNASNGVAVNITNVGSGSSHTLNVAFDGVNTKFKATHTTGQKAKITRSAQLVISMNGVIQQPHDTATPSTGFGFDLDGTIVFSQAPVSSDVFWAHVLTNNNVTFDISDNDIDNFTGDGSTVSFNLSKSPPDNRNILVTVDGVVQYPNDPDGTERSYAVVENVLTFSVAPALGTEVQVRHIGFAGSTSGGGSGGVTSVYGRTGAVVLKSTDNITVNDAAITGNATVTGDLTVNGTTTTLDTQLVEVDKIEVETTSTNVAIAVTHNGSGDLVRLHDGTSQVVTVDDEGKVGLGSAIPTQKLDVTGNIKASGIITATSFVGSGANLTSLPAQITFSNPSNNRILTSEGGIGVNAESKLTFDSTTTQLKITRDDDSNSGLYVFHNDGNECARLVQKGTGHEGTLVLRDGGTAKVLLDGETGSPSWFNAGNVGIGTEIPSQNLDIVNASGAANLQLKATTNSFNSFIMDSNRAADTQFAIIDGRWNGSSVARIQFVTGSDGTNKDDGYMAFWTRESGSSLAERVRITKEGNIGINSMTPDAQFKVDAVGKGIFTTSDTLSSNDFNKGQFTVRNKAGGQGAFLDFRATSGNGVGRGVIAKIGGFNTFSGTGYDGELTFSTRQNSNNTMVERLRITADAKFGFNDSDPERTIDVKGSNCMIQLEGTGGNGRQYSLCSTDDTTGAAVGPAGQFVIYDDTSSADRFTIKSDGNIGIGLTNPGVKLDVSGAVQATSGYKTAGHPVLVYASFTDITGGSYATRVGSTGTSTLRHTQIYGGGNHIATFDGVNYRLGIYETAPDASLHITGGLPHIRLENSGTSASAGDIFGQIDFKHNDSSDAGVTAAIKCVAEDANGNSFLAFYNGDGGNADERLRLTSTGNVNIGGNYTQGTYRAQIMTGANKFISFTNAAHDEFTDEASAIIFSRQSDGAKELSGIFEHSNTSFGIATRSNLTLHAGGTSTYSASPERMRITSEGKVLIGTQSSLSFNGVGQNHNLIVAGDSNDQDITDNYNAAITISNTDGTANNTAGLHFAREDTDGNPHYNGASVVAQFLESMNTGQYPKADLAFLTATANNNAPSEKMRIKADGNVRASIGSFDSLIGYTVNVSVDTTNWAQSTFYRVVDDNVFDNSNDTYLVWFKWSHGGSNAPWIITGNFIWTSTGTNVNGVASHVFTPVQSTHNSTATISFQGIAAGQVRQGLQARADTWDPSGGTLYIKASKIGHPS